MYVHFTENVTFSFFANIYFACWYFRESLSGEIPSHASKASIPKVNSNNLLIQ